MVNTTALQTITTLFCAFIASAVILHGVHSKDLVALSAIQDIKVHTEEHNGKIASDLHNHIDKQSFKSMVKHVGDTGFQIDSRSLRMLKEELFEPRKLPQLKVWLTYLRAKLSLTISLL